MSSLKLFIVRHAPVVGQKGFIYGEEADIDLEGQIEMLQLLADKLPSPEKSVWYHSGVDRARRTANAILSLMGQSHENISGHEGFKEQDFGDLIGCRHEDITNHLTFVKGKIHAPHPPNGESIEKFVCRVGSAIKDVGTISSSNGKQSVVIFSHGGTIRAAHTAINELPLQNFIILDTPPLFAYECSIEKLCK